MRKTALQNKLTLNNYSSNGKQTAERLQLHSKWILLWNQYSLKTAFQNNVKLVNKEPSDFWFHQVLRCFGVVWSQFWTSSKCFLALETTTNNQEVKWSLYKLQNVNNLPKDYIRMCLTCRSIAELFNFIGLLHTNNTSIRICKYQWP